MLIGLAVHAPEGRRRVQAAARPGGRLEGAAAVEEGVAQLPGPALLLDGPRPAQATKPLHDNDHPMRRCSSCEQEQLRSTPSFLDAAVMH